MKKRLFTLLMTGVVAAGNLPQASMSILAAEFAQDSILLETEETKTEETEVEKTEEADTEEENEAEETKVAEAEEAEEIEVAEAEAEENEVEKTETEENEAEVTLTNLEEVSEEMSIAAVSDILEVSSAITVSVEVRGDSKHGSSSIHGLALGGLTVWASDSKFLAESGDTVWDVLEAFCDAHNIDVKYNGNNQYGSIYIEALTYKGVTLGEFDNTSMSGWMYTLNGKHPDVGVSAKTVSNGDKIVLHFTDDYSYEEGGYNYGKKPTTGDSGNNNSGNNSSGNDNSSSSDSNKDDTTIDTPTDNVTVTVPEISYSISYTDSFAYTGSAIKPNVVVKDNNRTLAEGSDYSVSYKNNINAGTGQIIIKGKNAYASLNETKSFTIAKCSLSDASIRTTSIYSEKTVKNPVPEITRNGKKLSNGKDFTLIYDNGSTYSSSGTIKVTGTGNYEGTITVPVTIVDASSANLLSKAKVSNVKNFTYGQDYKQSPTVKFGKEVLTEGKDYTISYENADKAGNATMILTGMGNYVGEKRVTFKITALNIKTATVSNLNSTVNYTGSAVTTNAALTLNGKSLVEGTDYTVNYGKNVSAGKASVTFTGIGGYTGTLKKTFTIEKCSLESASVSIVGGTTHSYVKGGVKPSVNVLVNGIALREKTDYTISYKNNKKVGTATIIIKGKGSFTGKIEKTFTIK